MIVKNFIIKLVNINLNGGAIFNKNSIYGFYQPFDLNFIKVFN